MTSRSELIDVALTGALGRLAPALHRALVDAAAWTLLARGATLFARGEPADAWYLVVAGEIALDDGVPRSLRRGALVGAEALFPGALRHATAAARRDTALLRFTSAALGELAALHPTIALPITQAAVRRHPPRPPWRRDLDRAFVLAVIPTQPGDAHRALARALADALAAHGPTRHHDRTPPSLQGVSAEHFRAAVAAWLDDQTADARFVVLVCGDRADFWDHAVVAAADEVLLVADAAAAPRVEAHERALLPTPRGPHDAPRTLALVHPATTTLPQATARWFEGRDLTRHRHLRAGRRDDLARLARAVAGREVGLVLGAGGARGVAHLGVLRALAEADVPVDLVGGTSVGALIGAAQAQGRSHQETADLGRQLQAAAPFRDWTLPVTSLLRGRRMEAVVRAAFGGAAIEDLWLPFFCNSCDIASFCDVTHERGGLADALLASCALPAVFAPRRRGDALLIDGGTTDMLPVATMRARSEGRLIAVDVSHERERHPTAAPSSRAMRWWRALTRDPAAWTLSEVFWRAAALDPVRRIQSAAADADLFLRPPVERYATDDLDRWDEVAALGYAHARGELARCAWLRPGEAGEQAAWRAGFGIAQSSQGSQELTPGLESERPQSRAHGEPWWVREEGARLCGRSDSSPGVSSCEPWEHQGNARRAK